MTDKRINVTIKASVDPAMMPDGMQIKHEGTVFTAFPEMPWLPGARWHGEDETIRTDQAIRDLLADGAEVLGVNQEEIDGYNAIMTSVRERNE